MPNTAAFKPRPSASVSATVRANDGWLAMVRAATLIEQDVRDRSGHVVITT